MLNKTLEDELSEKYRYFKQQWDTKAWTVNDTLQLEELVNDVNNGKIHGEWSPNEWYPLAVDLAKEGNLGLWQACTDDLLWFIPPVPFYVPHQSDDPVEIQRMISRWHFWHSNKFIPVWNPELQELSLLNETPSIWTINNIKTLMQAFATPLVYAQIEKQLHIMEALGITTAKESFEHTRNITKFVAWIFERQRKEAAVPENSYNLPSLE